MRECVRTSHSRIRQVVDEHDVKVMENARHEHLWYRIVMCYILARAIPDFKQIPFFCHTQAVLR